MQRVVQAVVDIHTREVTDAQVPSNIALYAQWGGGKSFAKGESVPARGLCQLARPLHQSAHHVRRAAPCGTKWWAWGWSNRTCLPPAR